MHNAVAENVLGTIGTILWCIQLVPQIIRNYYVKDCEGVPSLMMFLWAFSGVPFSIYFIGTDGSIPLRVQPEIFTFCCVATWAQTLYYPPVRCGMKKIILYVGTFIILSIGAEIGFILWLRPIYRGGKEWTMLIFGILASILISLGLIPPYFELAKRRGRVVGINFFFIGMDSLGALFSLISIVVGTMDTMSMVLYAIVIALELGIFTSHIIWYIRFNKKEKAMEMKLKQEQEQLEGQEPSDIQQEEEDEENEDERIEIQTPESETNKWRQHG